MRTLAGMIMMLSSVILFGIFGLHVFGVLFWGSWNDTGMLFGASYHVWGIYLLLILAIIVAQRYSRLRPRDRFGIPIRDHDQQEQQ